MQANTRKVLVVCNLAHTVLDPHVKTYQNRWLTSNALAAILLRCYKLDKEITLDGENINQVTSDQNHQMLASTGIGRITFEKFSANTCGIFNRRSLYRQKKGGDPERLKTFFFAPVEVVSKYLERVSGTQI